MLHSEICSIGLLVFLFVYTACIGQQQTTTLITTTKHKCTQHTNVQLDGHKTNGPANNQHVNTQKTISKHIQCNKKQALNKLLRQIIIYLMWRLAGLGGVGVRISEEACGTIGAPRGSSQFHHHH